MTKRLMTGVLVALWLAALPALVLTQSGSSLPDIPFPDPPIEWQGPLQETDGGIGTEIPLSPLPDPCCKDVCDGVLDCLKCYNMMILRTSWCVRWQR